MKKRLCSDLSPDLSQIKELLFDPCGLSISSFQSDPDSQEYAASSFKLNQKHITFRTSKITPKKTGQFVTVWKRDQNGITQPFTKSDALDFLIIGSRSGKNFGLFILPKSILIEKNIITDKKEGKRGIRVYPLWDQVTNKQAEKTQEWQIRYFLTLEYGVAIDKHIIKNLFVQ